MARCSICRTETSDWLEDSEGKIYCSESCFQQTWPKCAACGIRMQEWLTSDSGRKYCSDTCFQTTLPQCAACGTRMERWTEAEDGRKYCSEKCFQQSWPTCAICGKRMKQWIFTEDGRKYCSDACREQTLPTCAICGKRMKEWIIAEDDRQYCSDACREQTLPTCAICGTRMKEWTETADGDKYCSESCSRTTWPRCVECDVPMQQWYIVEDDRKLCELCVPTCSICGQHLKEGQEDEDGLIYCSDYCRETEEECITIRRAHTPSDFTAVGAAIGSVGNAQLYADNVILLSERGHGVAAERANTFLDRISGKDARHIGGDNVKDGADRVVNGINVQTKYCNSGSKCIQECFENGHFRYLNAEGTPMQIEVPADKYESAVQAMEVRIKRGQISGVTDPAKARELIRKGAFTYGQVRNMAKFGTIESLTYDSVNHAVTASSAFGVSALITYASALWNGQDHKAALKAGVASGIKVGGATWVSGVITSQIERSGVDTVLRQGSNYVIKQIGPKAAAWLARGLSGGKNVLSGAAAMNNASKLLRGNVVTGTVITVVLSAADISRLVQGKISGAQAFKNITVTAVSVAGGTGGWMVGATVGAEFGATVGSVLPIIGTAIGGVVGGFVGGLLGGVAGGGAAGAVSKAVLDEFIEDDSTQMMRILEKHFARFSEEFLLSEYDIDQVGTALQQLDIPSLMRNLYASNHRHATAARILRPIIIEVACKRPSIALPGDGEVNACIKEIVEEAA